MLSQKPGNITSLVWLEKHDAEVRRKVLDELIAKADDEYTEGAVEWLKKQAKE